MWARTAGRALDPLMSLSCTTSTRRARGSDHEIATKMMWFFRDGYKEKMKMKKMEKTKPEGGFFFAHDPVRQSETDSTHPPTPFVISTPHSTGSTSFSHSP